MAIKKLNCINTVKIKKGFIKPMWRRFDKNDKRMSFLPITIENSRLGKLNINFERYDDIAEKCLIEINNSHKESIGREIFSLPKGVETIYGYSIKVEPQYRHLENKANYRLGEVLRLGSIMTMLKNKYKSIRIFSVNDAIYFHSKYKFVPNIENIKEMKFALTTLIDDCSPLVLDLSKKAKELFVKVTKVDSENSKKQIGLEVNALIKEYITRVLKEGKNGKGHAFQKGFDMILTEEIVKNNATFFNKLFKKHGIDYKI